MFSLCLGLILSKLHKYTCLTKILIISLFFRTFWCASFPTIYHFEMLFWSSNCSSNFLKKKLLKITLSKIIPYNTFEKTGNTDIWLYLSQYLNWNLNSSNVWSMPWTWLSKMEWYYFKNIEVLSSFFCCLDPKLAQVELQQNNQYVLRCGYSVSKRLVKPTTFQCFPLHVSEYQVIRSLSLALRYQR